MPNYLQIQTTINNKEEAARLSREIVSRRLAACGQIIGPIKSIYWWKNCMEETEEWLCLFKTPARNFEKLAEAIKRLHPYEEPEIIALLIARGSRNYLAWIDRETHGE